MDIQPKFAKELVALIWGVAFARAFARFWFLRLFSHAHAHVRTYAPMHTTHTRKHIQTLANTRTHTRYDRDYGGGYMMCSSDDALCSGCRPGRCFRNVFTGEPQCTDCYKGFGPDPEDRSRCVLVCVPGCLCLLVCVV